MTIGRTISAIVAAASVLAAAQPASAFDLRSWHVGGLPQPRRLGMGELIYAATEVMVQRADIVAHDRPILVTTIVSVNDYTRSSTFGRLASQLVTSRLAQHEFLIKDATYMRALSIRPETGEVVLSRDVRDLGASLSAQAVVTGTYAVAGEFIYLNLRMVSALDGSIISTSDVVIPLNLNTEPLVTASN